ncbi:PREDICTED: conserved oligomeric Golgi complex subunit 2 isoform X1 [Papilio xuthus]|uniref:Conserved oligomeric Golgi complex subunit 2 n=1 Tax=Papilio xuthus TaxID=66420 RepID=A0AAJ7EBZ3_PAPXU|nr:PREDICTED: conserved oligomeric Golgi complex subunit 2 isoform X1 [Papilio xuthus]
MDKNNTDFTLPPARGLCFDRNDFIKTNFSVDTFLTDHQNVASLEKMRDDLGVYLKVLRLAMIELINKDYANFVNLCATLIGFDKAIVKIQVPLEQLNEEVVNVKQCLEDAMKELSIWLNQRHSLLKKKQLLKHYSQTVNSLRTLETIFRDISDKKKLEQIIVAERTALLYNQLKFTFSTCENLLSSEQKELYNDIGGKLIQILNTLLFHFWNENDENNLLKTLLILTTLDRIKETELLIRKQAIAPLLQDIINEPALQRSKDGLEGIYNKIMALLDTKLKLFLTVMQHSTLTFLAKKYRFLVNCFWCEVESRIEVNLASIFAPGNPQLFYKRYSESIQFVRKLEEYCIAEGTVQLLHDTLEYKRFQKRWNLPVYFQIRFQEIAGGFESSLKKSPTVENKDGFIHKETLKCWVSLHNCWSDGIYIEALAHKFWKLSLQLLARYASWTTSVCSQQDSMRKLETTGINATLIDNSLNIYVDTQTLLQKLPNFLAHVESKIPIEKSKPLLRESLNSSIEILKQTESKIRDCIVNELYENFNIQLKQVSDIPRLYRKTNRSIPTKPCAYIDVVTNSLRDFNEGAVNKVDNLFLIGLYEALFNVMTISYYKYVEDVLTSVQKTEESLRRLKQIRDMASQQNIESTGTTDGDKIRLQLNVDVLSYTRLAQSLSVEVYKVHKFNELSSMITEAVKNIEIK